MGLQSFVIKLVCQNVSKNAYETLNSLPISLVIELKSISTNIWRPSFPASLSTYQVLLYSIIMIPSVHGIVILPNTIPGLIQ